MTANRSKVIYSNLVNCPHFEMVLLEHMKYIICQYGMEAGQSRKWEGQTSYPSPISLRLGVPYVDQVN